MVQPARAASAVLLLSPIYGGQSINQGCFTIRYAGNLPPGARVFLCVGNKDNRIDITGQYGVQHRTSLLKALEQYGHWAEEVPAWLVAEQNGSKIAESNRGHSIPAPVKPFDGELTFASVGAQNPPLTYCGNGFGRLLTDGKLTDKYYFRNTLDGGGKLEHDPKMRGFDCTTFIMSLLQVFPNMTGKYGTFLVESLGAINCDLEQVKAGDAARIFQFPVARMGFYVMWSAGHMVLVKDAMLHEFRGNGNGWAAAGYRVTPAGGWPSYFNAPQWLWWIRQLPGRYSA